MEKGSSWRPEKGWKNPYEGTSTNRESSWKEERAYEKGADAILKALIEEGEYEHASCDDACFQRDVLTVRFIPDKEVKYGRIWQKP